MFVVPAQLQGVISEHIGDRLGVDIKLTLCNILAQRGRIKAG
jgi:hypothetical protein